MGLFKDIADTLIKDEDLASLSRSECEAIIDAMTLLVYADGEETFLERQELEHLLHELPWALKDAQAVDVYLSKSSACMREAVERGDEGFDEAARGIADRLNDLATRKRAFKMAATIAYADWDTDDHEHHALHALAEAFEIPEPFARAMISDIEHTGTPASLEEDTDPEAIPAPTTRTVREVLSKDFLEGFFTNLFDDEDLKHLSEDASYAFVDALSIALVADGYPEPEELTEFKAQLESLPFAAEDADHVRARVEIAINTLREATGAEIDAYIEEIGQKIPSDSLKESALRMAVAITHADMEISAEETSMLHRMARHFGLETEQVHQIVERIRSEGAEGFLS